MDSKERLEICKSCSSYKNNISMCMECGCIMPLKVKIKNASCPKDKW
jgi:hypothetical protein